MQTFKCYSFTNVEEEEENVMLIFNKAKEMERFISFFTHNRFLDI
jgi:hypothetical protein